MNIAIYYGSNNGNTENIAKIVQQQLGGKEAVKLYDVALLDNADSMLGFDLLLWGCPTWGEGDLQDDWESFYENLDSINLSGKTVALFGLGDQDSYGHEFISALKILHDKAQQCGAKIIGYWPDDGYEYDSSESVSDGYFCGLAIDEDNQEELTNARVEQWCGQLKQEAGL